MKALETLRFEHTDQPNLVKHVLDELDLVRDLGTSEDRQEGPLRVLQRFRKVLQFLLHQEPSRALGQLDANHG